MNESGERRDKKASKRLGELKVLNDAPIGRDGFRRKEGMPVRKSERSMPAPLRTLLPFALVVGGLSPRTVVFVTKPSADQVHKRRSPDH